METYITICKIDSQWEFAVCLRKLKQGLCINLELWDGEGERGEAQQGGNICIPMADSYWFDKNNKFCKAITLQVKKSGGGGVLRWQRNRTGTPLSPPQIHQKNI